MPECRRCHRILATAELRRTTLGHLCKDHGPGTRCWTLEREQRALDRRARGREAVSPTRSAEASVG